jgi:hypothetical protein
VQFPIDTTEFYEQAKEIAAAAAPGRSGSAASARANRGGDSGIEVRGWGNGKKNEKKKKKKHKPDTRNPIRDPPNNLPSPPNA